MEEVRPNKNLYQMVPMPAEEMSQDATNEPTVDAHTAIEARGNATVNHSPISQRSSLSSPPSSPSSSGSLCKSNYINFILIIISFLILNFQKNQINSLKNELILQQQKYNEYVITNQLSTNNITTNINNLKAIASSHDKLLIRLTTNTSNADVLDRLKDTKLYVNQKLGMHYYYYYYYYNNY